MNDSMIALDDAQQIVLGQVSAMPAQEASLIEALGRVVARDLTSDIDVAPFDNSAMDGFAFHASDVEGAEAEQPVSLKLVAHIGAGDVYDKTVEGGQAVRIMTGAAVPAGCDTVQMIEKVTFTGEGTVGDDVLIHSAVPVGKNIRNAGEEVRAGDVVMTSGTLLTAAGLGLLASTGNVRIPVYARPKVGIISLGSELVEADAVPGPGKLRNANSIALAGCVADAGALPVMYPLVSDDEEAIRDAVRKAVAECDFVVSSGGASAGDYDYITQVADSLGKVFFKYVNMRPGKSQTFAVIDGVPFLGLAGNPTSAVVGFEMLVRPALLKAQGRTCVFRPMQKARLSREMHKHDSRPQYMRGRVVRDESGALIAIPEKRQSSALLATLQRADSLIVFPGEVSDLLAGAEVDCVRIDQEPGAVL